MNLITSTQLRTQTPKLIDALLAGYSVDLIHRSKIIGEFRPKTSKIRVFNAARMKRIVKKLHYPSLTQKQIEKRYRDHLMSKYGKNLSRHKHSN